MRIGIVALTCALTLAATSAALSAPVRLVESGSTLLYPLMNTWVASYTKLHPEIDIGTEASGSGKGISDAIKGSAQIGASDAYMSDKQLVKSPMLNIPLAISAVFVAYNVPELGSQVHLRLSGTVLARIYDGTIRYWDDPQILALNRELAGRMSHHVIIRVHRYEGSGDTFIFTQYLSVADPLWAKHAGFGTSIQWSAGDTVGAFHNTGMVEVCRNVPYAIAYVGISYLDQALAANIGFAALQNHDGKFVTPGTDTIAAAASVLADRTPKDQRISLVYAPGTNSYPMINYEYAIVASHQANKETADELARFLAWAISPAGGSAQDLLAPVHFLALPERIMEQSKAQIAQIGG